MSAEASIWDYFEKSKDKSLKIATCRLCNGTYSHSSTSANLRLHLEHKHGDEITVPQKRDRPPRMTPRGKYNKIIWGYFSQVEGQNRLAACNLCDRVCSFRSTTSNLKSHLRRIHPDAYNRFIEFLPPDLDDVSKEVFLEYSDDDAKSNGSEEPMPLSSFFEKESEGLLSCVFCSASVPHYEVSLKKHLLLKHPNFKFSDEDQPMPFHSDDEPEQKTHTEVIYVDDAGNVEKSTQIVQTSKLATSSNVKKQKRRAVRRDSTSSDEYKIKREKTEEPDELKDFLKYTSSLLKKLPKETCMKLQMEIVNLILNASLKQCDSTSVATTAPSTSTYYVTVPDKVIQSTNQVTEENTSDDLGVNIQAELPVIGNSPNETDNQ